MPDMGFTSHSDSQEQAEWGNFLEQMINDLLALRDVSADINDCSQQLRQLLEIEFESLGGEISFVDEGHIRNHLLYVHGRLSSSYSDPHTAHKSCHPKNS